MEQVAYGSHSANFNKNQPTFYSEQFYPANGGTTNRNNTHSLPPLLNGGPSITPAVNGISKYHQFANNVN